MCGHWSKGSNLIGMGLDRECLVDTEHLEEEGQLFPKGLDDRGAQHSWMSPYVVPQYFTSAYKMQI